MNLTAMQYVVAALAQAKACDMTLDELLRVAMDATSPEHFDALVNTFTDHTRND